MASTLRPSLLRPLLATRASPSVQRLNLQPLSRPSWALQRAAFQTSAKRPLLPPLPQKIEGTVNDPAAVHGPHPSEGSYHWTAERVVSVALIPITITPFAAGSLSPLLDGTLIGLIIIHTYMGFQSVITDYLPKWRVPRSRRLFEWGNVLAVFVVGWGYYEFETNDVGLTQAIKRIWKARSTPIVQ